MLPDAEEVDGVVASHRELLETIAGLDDARARRASRLPGWSIGHVLTHLARHADSQLRALAGAARGEIIDRYPGGLEVRNAEIESGAERPATELVADVRETSERLELAYATLPPEAWSRPGSSLGRPEAIAVLPFRRWREVQVHHADLGLDFGPADWADGYVRRELRNAAMAWRARQPMGQTELPPEALALPPHPRLAWLLGRAAVDGLPAVEQWW